MSKLQDLRKFSGQSKWLEIGVCMTDHPDDEDCTIIMKLLAVGYVSQQTIDDILDLLLKNTSYTAIIIR